MTGPQMEEEKEISVFALGTLFVRNRWRIGRWMLIGGVLTALSVASRPALYSASASFTPQGVDPARSGLATVAGQLGMNIPSSNQTQSPDFYVQLLSSRVVLEPIVRDTFAVPELSPRPLTFQEIFKISGGSERSREEQAVETLRGTIGTSVARTTGIIELRVATRWPSLSLAIVTDLVNGLNEYNRVTRKAQAEAERKFIESQLTIASTDLRAAEDRLEGFLRTNRDFAGSPELAFQRDRLQRDVGLKQQVFTTLTQAYEDVRIREVRDTPVLSLIEAPSVPTVPAPRGRVKSVLIGLLLGAIFGALLSWLSAVISRRRAEGNPEADEFFSVLDELKAKINRGVPFIKQRNES